MNESACKLIKRYLVVQCKIIRVTSCIRLTEFDVIVIKKR